MFCNYVLCVVFDCWMSPGGRWCYQTMFGTPGVARVVQLLEDGERLRVSPRIPYLTPERSQPTIDMLTGDWIMHQEKGAMSFRDDKPNVRPFPCIVVLSQSHEYS